MVEGPEKTPASPAPAAEEAPVRVPEHSAPAPADAPDEGEYKYTD